MLNNVFKKKKKTILKFTRAVVTPLRKAASYEPRI